MNLLQLLSNYPIWTVILITVASIIIILKLIEWGKKTWQKRQDFKTAAMHEGEKHQQQEDLAQHEKESLEKRIKELENHYSEMEKIFQKQQETLDLLKESDELNIKAWIKAQHDRWMPSGCIDSQSLELICQRFAIYQKEGGNSWAERMVEDIEQLTIVTNIPL